eukprot:459963-Hanusia_phi.AAC.1
MTISHAHTHTKQRKAWEEAPTVPRDESPEIKALRSAQTRRTLQSPRSSGRTHSGELQPAVTG